MANLPSVRRITREDLRGAPEWVNNLLLPLNSFMESVYSALDQNLTLGDNVSAAVTSISFKTRSDYGTASPLTDGFEMQTLANPLRYRPKAVAIGGVVEKEKFSILTDPVYLHWEYLNGQIRIKYVAGLQPSKKYDINLLIF